MDIIVKETFNLLIWERVASFERVLKYGNLGANNRLPNLERLQNVPIYRATDQLSTFLTSILTADRPDRLPNTVKFSYTEMESQGLEPDDIASSVRMSYTLACMRLQIKPKKFVLSGHTSKPINKTYQKKLIDSGFCGGTVAYDDKDKTEQNAKNLYWRHHMDWWQDGTVASQEKDNATKLTYRQQEVLHLIVKRGLKNAQIARELKVSEQAIKMHVSAIMKKYGVRNRTQLALFSSAQKI